MKDYTKHIEEINQYYGYPKITSDLHQYDIRDIIANYLRLTRIKKGMSPVRKDAVVNHIRKTTGRIFEQLLDIHEQLELLNNDPDCSSIVSFERIAQLSEELLDRLQDIEGRVSA